MVVFVPFFYWFQCSSTGPQQKQSADIFFKSPELGVLNCLVYDILKRKFLLLFHNNYNILTGPHG